MQPVQRFRNQRDVTFASAIFPSKYSETQALLLADSIRGFAGTLSGAPIWYFTPEHGQQLSEAVRGKLLALDVSLSSFRISSEVLRFPFAGYVLAAALAESMARGQTDFLAWLAADTVVLQEPKDFLLQDGKYLGVRPVHHTLVGSRYDEPLDPFWALIYRYCKVPEDRAFPMTTIVDETRIRPYFNAGLLVTRPRERLFKAWCDAFLKACRGPSFQEFHRMDGRYAIFLHQAILAGVVLATLTPSQIQQLPPEYNYPLHLYAQDRTKCRPSHLEELRTFRYEQFFKDSEWMKKIPAKEPLRQWLSERIPR